MKVAPHEASIQLKYGMILSDQQRWREAIEVYGQALLHDKIPANLHHWKAVAHEQLGEFVRAEFHYREEARLRPHDSSPWIALGEFLARREKYQQALECFEKVSKNDLNHEIALDRLKTVRQLMNKK
jgi:tetratricopeptide (TPR) repeat protein